MESGDTVGQELAEVLRGQLASIRLQISGEASLAGADLEDPGTMDWQGEATLSVWPEEDESSVVWRDEVGTALSVANISEGGRELQILSASGLVVDLWSVEDVFAALDARSQDYAEFLPMFGARGSFGQVELAAELDDMLEPGGSRVVIVDRVHLAPAWRGLGGIGRLLTARLLRWVAEDARVVALSPFPVELDDQELENPVIFDPALAKVRHVWESLAFEPFTEKIWVMDPRMSGHDRAVRTLVKRLGLSQRHR